MALIIFNDNYTHEILDSSTRECIQAIFTSALEFGEFLGHFSMEEETKYSIDRGGNIEECSAMFNTQQSLPDGKRINATIYMREKTEVEKLADRVTALEEKINNIESSLKDLVGGTVIGEIK